MTDIPNDDITKSDLLAYTSEIVSSYVSNNPVASGDLPGLIQKVHLQMNDLASPGKSEDVRKEPAVPIKKSIADDYIICLEDGKKLKMLKRYIRTRFDLTPEEYRARWGLPGDYPMVAPAYARKRSAFAKEIGLGRKPK